MDDETYAATLAAYENRINNMSETERREYFREDFDDEGEYLYPEYMDFMDTWQYDFHYQACKHAEHFIKERLCGFEMRMVCMDHEHEFHLLPPSSWKETVQKSEHVYLTKETMLDTETCWYKTVLNGIHQLRDIDRTGLMDLTDPDHEYLRMLCNHYGRINAMPDEKIQKRLFEAYKNLWYYGISEQKESLEYLKEYFDANGIRLLIASIVNRARHEQVRETITRKPELLLSKEVIENDHGYHNFIHSLGDMNRGVVNRMNRLRMQAEPYQGASPEDILLSYDIESKTKKCQRCNDDLKRGRKIVGSPPGMFYGPPGMGKSTVLNLGYFIGLDTDWLTSMLRYDDIIWFLSQQIAVITNQYSLSQLSDTTMIGFICPQQLRLQANGQPFTTEKEIDDYRRYNVKNFLLIKTKKRKKPYMSDYILQMYLAKYYSDRTVELLKRWRTGPLT